MKIIINIIAAAASAILILLILAYIVIMVNVCNREYYWNYECDWVSDNPEIEIYYGCGEGRMVIDGVEYVFNTSRSNNATDIEFYEPAPEMGITEEKVFWKADTKLKDGKLHLTVTVDKISDYLGKTIVLSQRPIEKEELT